MSEFSVGDAVECVDPGSWVDGRTGVITALDVVSPDDIRGHALQVDGAGWTVLEPSCLRGRAVRRPVPSLDSLLAGMTDDKAHDEVDFGPPVGKEVL